MVKFVKPFSGCKAGDIYPTSFSEGDDCPPELEAAARSVGAVAERKAARKAPEDK